MSDLVEIECPECLWTFEIRWQDDSPMTHRDRDANFCPGCGADIRNHA